MHANLTYIAGNRAFSTYEQAMQYCISCDFDFHTMIQIREDPVPQPEQPKLYWYEMVLRGISPFCQPKGFVSQDETKGRHGIVAYSRPLTQVELSDYEMREWGGLNLTLEEFIEDGEQYQREKDLFYSLFPIEFNAIKIEGTRNRYAIVHHATYGEYKYQVSFFDQRGAYMDCKRDTLQEIAEECYTMDFKNVIEYV